MLRRFMARFGLWALVFVHECSQFAGLRSSSERSFVHHTQFLTDHESPTFRPQIRNRPLSLKQISQSHSRACRSHASCVQLRGGDTHEEVNETSLNTSATPKPARAWGMTQEQSAFYNNSLEEANNIEFEVMAFLQRAASIIQSAGGRMDSKMFAHQWVETFPDDPLSHEQVVTAVAGILNESGYFNVEETPDPSVKIFELMEQAEEGGTDVQVPLYLPFDLPPPEEDPFLDRAREWLACTGVGRHPAVGQGLMTYADLATAINPPDPPPPGVVRRRHDEVNYTSKWGSPISGYWTLGPCTGSNGCLHGGREAVGAQSHWTCCGCTDIRSVFCRGFGGSDAAPPRPAAAAAAQESPVALASAAKPLFGADAAAAAGIGSSSSVWGGGGRGG